ncbi:MAG TPA: 2-iminoacetate synthase ThiH [Candidatus Omnitrophota bacterium]|jgi:2-iminoacetate synthase|nr:MAG: 2-iminoacetate synthase [Candidatus Omnitrophica bacterium ADurb.Bin314]HQB94397.1 2-iminoacetate synthase ThiH [Candidatus Omnitrophota bacterium]
MSFYDTLQQYKDFFSANAFRDVTAAEVRRAVLDDDPRSERLFALLSPAAADQIELMAQRAHEITLRQFGRVIQLYTPMYLSNFCENQCEYCGFNATNRLPRRTMTLEEVEREAAYIASTGLEHILILTGDARKRAPVSYIRDAVQVLRKHFSSISVEVYALTEAEYAELAAEGVDGLTIYQETYDEAVYDRVHRSGPKKDFRFRLEAPERAARSGMRSVNIGALLGLSDWRVEAFRLGLHARYLQDTFPDVEVGASVPRLRPHEGDFRGDEKISDRDFVQIILAMRLFLPRLGLTLSTRESSELREHLVPLGITKMSAGSTTEVGGHTLATKTDRSAPQFRIADERDVEAIKAMLAAKGYQPVLKDWMPI